MTVYGFETFTGRTSSKDHYALWAAFQHALHPILPGSPRCVLLRRRRGPTGGKAILRGLEPNTNFRPNADEN